METRSSKWMVLVFGRFFPRKNKHVHEGWVVGNLFSGCFLFPNKKQVHEGWGWCHFC